MSDEFRKIPRSYSQEIEKSGRTSRDKVVNDLHDPERDFDKSQPSFEKQTDWLRISAIAFVAILLAGTGVLYLRSKSSAPVVDKSSKPAKIVEGVLLDSSKGNWKGGSPREIAEKFLAAKTHEQRLLWVKNPEETSDILREFYETGVGKNLKVTKLTPLPQVIGNEDNHSRFAVNIDDGTIRFLCVPYAENGDGKVDFKCYSLYGSASWQALFDGSATKADEVRVITEPSNYYNGEFTDESKWISIIATSTDLDIAYFYIPKDQPEMARFFSDPKMAAARYTLAIESIGKSYQRRQFAVTRVLCASWLSE
jgi:hypothetical protein